MRAARGVDGRRFPWGDRGLDEPDYVRARANVWKGETAAMSRWNGSDQERQSYLRGVIPVGDTDHQDITTDGLVHMLGNVSEWTESIPDGARFGLPADRPHSRLFVGAAWGDYADLHKTLADESIDNVGAVMLGRGFRCAKSDTQSPPR